MLYGSGARIDFLKLDLKPIGAIWFLLALLWSTIFLTILVRVLRRIQSNWKMIYMITYVILLFIIAIITSDYIWLPFSIQAGMAGTLFMAFGYLYISCKAKIVEQRFPLIVTIAVFLWLFAICLSFYNDRMSLVACRFPNPIFNVIGAISGSFVVVWFSKKVDGCTKITVPLKYIGRNSLMALSIHLVELDYMPWYLLGRLGLDVRIYTCLIYVMKIAMIYVGIYCANRIPCVRKLFA